ncbi:MAG: hypothetical protein OEN21_04385 [Myxococcales bacterium]|nr:hypothetical protein [Myxococcales bacterium]
MEWIIAHSGQRDLTATSLSFVRFVEHAGKHPSGGVRGSATRRFRGDVVHVPGARGGCHFNSTTKAAVRSLVEAISIL